MSPLPTRAEPALALPQWLSAESAVLVFNRRVLAQARRADVPLLERLRYVTIVSSNMDEFFEVRFAEALEAARAAQESRSSLRGVAAQAYALLDDLYAVYSDELTPLLRDAGIVILNHTQRGPAQCQWVSRYFEQQVRPLLIPTGLDPAHPFPLVANKSLNFIVRLGRRDALGRDNAIAIAIAIVKVPRALPRVIALPPEVCAPGVQGFVLSTSIIRAHLQDLFPGRPVESLSQFRVTRDCDLDVDQDDVANLRQALRLGLTTHHFGRAIRLEVVRSCAEALWRFLLQQFDLPAPALHKVNGPVNLVRLNQLIDQAHAPHLRLAPQEPPWPAATLPREGSMFDQLRQGDVLLHHPFESFEPVIQLLREAVADPNVLAIRQTIYRTGAQSELMDLLLEAARRGKEVLAVVELKARFDEEANINWAERLEAVGAQVVYGIVGFKTHAKLLLVTRREAHGRGSTMLRCYVHLSTGNYNPRPARLYTDIGMLGADPQLAADADAGFQQLASLTGMRPRRHLLAAPFTLHRRLLQCLHRVEQAARAGHSARVVVKLNALTEPGLALVLALVEAARAGAQIDLLIRGACILPPQVSGVGEHIRVRSIVGRFLEHTRVLYPRWGDQADDEVLYLTSADWMGRNMFRRIEVAWPVRDPTLRQRVIDECLVPYLHDQRDAWVLQADGGYERLARQGVSAQHDLLQHYG